MKITFRSPDPEGRKLKDDATVRVQRAMRRLTWLVGHVRVQLVDINGSAGGVDKRCRIEARLPSREPVVITAVAREWRGALDAALACTVQRLLRVWRRRGGQRRLRLPMRKSAA